MWNRVAELGRVPIKLQFDPGVVFDFSIIVTSAFLSIPASREHLNRREKVRTIYCSQLLNTTLLILKAPAQLHFERYQILRIALYPPTIWTAPLFKDSTTFILHQQHLYCCKQATFALLIVFNCTHIVHCVQFLERAPTKFGLKSWRGIRGWLQVWRSHHCQVDDQEGRVSADGLETDGA